MIIISLDTAQSEPLPASLDKLQAAAETRHRISTAALLISGNIQPGIWYSYFGVLRGMTSASNPKHGGVGHVLCRLMM
jgi:hypothetical protein